MNTPARDSGYFSPPYLYSLVLVVLVTLPFALRTGLDRPLSGSLPLVVISPHNEAIRYEFGRAFSRWYEDKYGQPVIVDWRNIGGTSEIGRYLSAQYTAAFRAEWTDRGRQWSTAIANAFNNPKVKAGDTSLPADLREARQAFLESDVGVGIDLFFGGGEYDHSRQAAMGHLAPSGFRDTPEGKAILGIQIPEVIGGEKWFDRDDLWYGATVSAFGICYNLDWLARIPGAREPVTWRDLGQPSLLGLVALADPSKSGSSAKAFEMVIQQEMAIAADGISPGSPDFQIALQKGWHAGLGVVRLAAANSRYFTDSASKVPLDVSMGDSAAGMCIDFYGLFQASLVSRPDGTSRMRYVSPSGGTTVGCDPIAMLRGAPHPDLALHFIEFVLSMEGQRLWAYRTGTPGGPQRYALQRLPIRRDFYVPENLQYCSNPEASPFTQAESFTYRTEWTGKLFNAIRLLVRTSCLDTGNELREAWRMILAQGGPEKCPKAMERLIELPGNAHYDKVGETLAGIKTKVQEVALAREWGLFFAACYRQAVELAQQEGSGGPPL